MNQTLKFLHIVYQQPIIYWEVHQSQHTLNNEPFSTAWNIASGPGGQLCSQKTILSDQLLENTRPITTVIGHAPWFQASFNNTITQFITTHDKLQWCENAHFIIPLDNKSIWLVVTLTDDVRPMITHHLLLPAVNKLSQEYSQRFCSRKLDSFAAVSRSQMLFLSDPVWINHYRFTVDTSRHVKKNIVGEVAYRSRD